MNHECFVLVDPKTPLEIEWPLVQEVLEMLFHHILFHRALGGEVVAKERVLLDDLFYVQCNDQKIDKIVTASAKAAATALKRQDGPGKVSLTFLETVSGGLWGDKKVPWEEWVLHVSVRTEPVFGQPEALLRRRELEGRLKKLMWQIHSLVNQRRSHLPKVNISSVSAICFPFEIKDPSTKEGVLDFLGRAVSSGAKVKVPL
mmetsp:Transcript_43622/g.106663  ORF Transcript_43622/g.106663 Transcript_43622/m.106663 type:complete len:202 (+) Transcript_43622:34-639(+)|eukprot:CAMPEP_0206233184 /NCGR_PEP_ID=MMETSP0047_2-20121206/11841_1 /ASSEMBLY_ACC=CAM_ASM_000192 /TAXON_ID=195065 /ORGANISM="Chroomonas mesostigmatica_cf, Strain CCMP1168" /LENGTH=201 /DNA_ID=CAMNT_0053657025 /DNA_START=34 /DNA_END=639 /DNA_ORIENTATION=+